VLLVDARHYADYARGHIPGAINIPVTLAVQERDKRLDGWPRSSRIVVYCQSSGCDYDERVASELLLDGFRDISLFHEGWQEWERRGFECEQIEPQIVADMKSGISP